MKLNPMGAHSWCRACENPLTTTDFEAKRCTNCNTRLCALCERRSVVPQGRECRVCLDLLISNDVNFGGRASREEVKGVSLRLQTSSR